MDGADVCIPIAPRATISQLKFMILAQRGIRGTLYAENGNLLENRNLIENGLTNGSTVYLVSAAQWELCTVSTTTGSDTSTFLRKQDQSFIIEIVHSSNGWFRFHRVNERGVLTGTMVWSNLSTSDCSPINTKPREEDYAELDHKTIIDMPIQCGSWTVSAVGDTAIVSHADKTETKMFLMDSGFIIKAEGQNAGAVYQWDTGFERMLLKEAEEKLNGRYLPALS